MAHGPDQCGGQRQEESRPWVSAYVVAFPRDPESGPSEKAGCSKMNSEDERAKCSSSAFRRRSRAQIKSNVRPRPIRTR